MNFTVKITSYGTYYDIELDGVKYVRQNQVAIGEVLTIKEVRPVYASEVLSYGTDGNGYTDGTCTMTETKRLELAFTEMPRTRFRPGQKIRVIVE